MLGGTKPKVTEMGKVILTLRFEQEQEQWVGTCVELGTSTFAESLEQVQTELQELVELHLNALEEEGERERFFSDNGIEILWNTPKAWTVPDLSAKDFETGGLFQPRAFPIPGTPTDELVAAGR